MPEWSVFLVVFAAIAIGWLLGKFPLARYWLDFQNRAWRKSYMEGIHLLLSEEPDQAIEEFIQSWRVSSENFDLHNALANMLRRKGEVDRAIRIHANLVEAEKLPRQQTRQATLELATDYVVAGLFDRAERLLINVVNNSKDFEERALELLLQVYKREKEWEKAIAVAQQLLPKRSMSLEGKVISSGKGVVEIAHFYCEIAKEKLQKDSFKEAEDAIRQALLVDPNCARATLLLTELLLQKKQPMQALEALNRLQEQDAYLLSESVNLYKQCFGDDAEGFEAHLIALLKDYPSVQIEKAVYQSLQGHDEFAASEFLSQAVKHRPTLQGLDLLISDQLDLLTGAALENLKLLHQLVVDVLKDKTQYQCHSCGFSGNQLHWQCPQCHSWDTVRRIRGSEGD